MANTLDLQNGLLSFSNPNYNLASPDVNSNPSTGCGTLGEGLEEASLLLEGEEREGLDHEDPFEALYEELDAVCRFNRRSNALDAKTKTRRSYASLSIGSMGVDVDSGADLRPLLTTINIPSDSSPSKGFCERNNNQEGSNINTTNTTPGDTSASAAMGRKTNGFLEYYISLEAAANRNKKLVSGKAESDGSDTNDLESGRRNKSRVSTPENQEKCDTSENSDVIPHIHGQLTNDLYAVPVKRRPPKEIPPAAANNKQQLDMQVDEKADQEDDDDEEEYLPPGWERHEDDDGPYYWHISSGTIQREPPAVCPSQKSQAKRLSRDLDVICNFTSFTSSSKSSSVSSGSSRSGSSGSEQEKRQHRDEIRMKRRSYPQGVCSLTPDKKPIRFAVRSLGWVEIAEEDLTPERSSKAVNKCIVDLSLGRNDILDVVGRWGDGKDLYMDLDDYCLRLVNPQDFTVLNTQPIHTIRVWGVGRDNGRDFAYVARDRSTRTHMCHVFRCDNPARIIANTLRDICKKIMIERNLQQNMAKQVLPGSKSIGNLSSSGSSRERLAASRPTNLPTEQRRLNITCRAPYPSKSFPTPMEEPKKVLKAFYLGSTEVNRATGMEVLNCAIDRLVEALPRDKYKFVNVAVAPSTVTILEPGDDAKPIAECRVRFLSFLGIGHKVKTCAFIVQTAQEQFIAHGFYCEPSSGALCKTIEAACKLRYQKCLDAHRQVQERNEAEALQSKQGLTSTLRNVLGNLTTRLSKSAET